MPGWIRFLTSLKLAIVLLLLIIILSIVGTLIPQDQELSYYQQHFPSAVPWIKFFQLNHLYRSAIFLSLVFLFLLNLLFCSIKQLKSKLTLLKNRENFLAKFSAKKQGPVIQIKLPESLKTNHQFLLAALHQKKYAIKVRIKNGQPLIVARRGVAGLFGPEIVHLGLMIIIIGGLISALFTYRISVALIEGEIASVPKNNFSLRLNKFSTEYYPDGSVKNWKSQISIIENNGQPLNALVEVNHPFKYRGLNFYQISYGQDWDRATVELEIKTKETPSRKVVLKSGETMKIEPAMNVRLLSFVPDFQVDSANQIINRSGVANNPAALIEIQSAGQIIFSGWVFYLYPDFIQFQQKNKPEVKVTLRKFSAPLFSVLEISSDPGTGLVWMGSALLMLGLLFSFYFHYQELQILVDLNGYVQIFPYAQKNRENFYHETEQFLKNLIKIQADKGNRDE